MRIIRSRGTAVSSLLNIIGLSAAFAALYFILVQVRWDMTYDRNFPESGKVFRMEHGFLGDGLFTTFFSRPVIEACREASPDIEAVGTLGGLWSEVYYREGDRESAVTVPSIGADASIFSVFPFEWAEGSDRDFTVPGTAVICEAFAKMFFDGESAVGKVLETGDGRRTRIVGVFKDTPKNYSLHYGLIAYLGDGDIDNASEWSYFSFLKLKDPSRAAEVEAQLEQAILGYFGDEFSAEEARTMGEEFRIRNLHDAHYERDVRANVVGADKAVTVTLAAIALLLILIAIINFVNFSFVEIPFHIKSINTRKVLGESRSSLVRRQLLHTGALVLIAFAVAVGVVRWISGTSWASIVSGSLRLSDNVGMLAVILAVALLSAVVAGIAPALYSTAQPAALVLKGSYAMSVKGKALRGALVALQFFLSFVFIIGALYVQVQTRYMMRQDMGFDQERVLQVWCGERAGSQHEALSDRLLQHPSIIASTFSDGLIVSDQKMGWSRDDDNGNPIYMEVLPVRDDFVSFFGLQVVEGRDFQPSDNQSGAGCFLVNENFVQAFPQFHAGSFMGGHMDEPAEIVGIVKDFNFKSLQHPMEPLALLDWGRNPWRSFQVMYVKVAPGTDYQEVSAFLRKTVCEFDPTRQPDEVAVRHLDEWIERMYQGEQALGRLVATASLVALLIALIGIIGLVFFETQLLRKEIAVRRVNGATVKDILAMINRKYLVWAAVSFVVAAPLAGYVILVWRRSFAYQAPVPVWIFAAALATVLALTAAVVTLRSLRAVAANPVDSLRNE